MSIFRVEHTTGFTVMSNYHLRDKNLSLKAKGLLSQMLSFPEEWDYTVSRIALVDITPKKVYNNIRLHFSEVEDDKNRCDRLQLLP